MPELNLSRLTLPLRNRDTIRLLGDCHAMHRLVMSAFPDVPDEAARAALGVLYRVEHAGRQPDVRVLVQSRAQPRLAFESRSIRAAGPQSLDGFIERVENGQHYRFRLHANPIRRVHRRATMGPDPERGRLHTESADSIGKRVALRGDEQRLAWLERKGSMAGFALLGAKVAPGLDSPAQAYEGFQQARSEPAGMTYGCKPSQDKGRIALETCTFEGVLEVRDAAALRIAIAAVIGPGKAFGCGLLSLARA